MNDKVKKYVLLRLPYLFIFWIADKIRQAFQFSAGDNIGIGILQSVLTPHRIRVFAVFLILTPPPGQ